MSRLVRMDEEQQRLTLSSFRELILTSSSFRILSCSHKRLSLTCRGRQSAFTRRRLSTRARVRARLTHVHVALCNLDRLGHLLQHLTRSHLQTQEQHVQPPGAARTRRHGTTPRWRWTQAQMDLSSSGHTTANSSCCVRGQRSRRTVSPVSSFEHDAVRQPRVLGDDGRSVLEPPDYSCYTCTAEPRGAGASPWR